MVKGEEMPIVQVKGKSKHYSYSPKGEKAALLASKTPGAKLIVDKNTDPRKVSLRKVTSATMKPSKVKRFGISNLKRGG